MTLMLLFDILIGCLVYNFRTAMNHLAARLAVCGSKASFQKSFTGIEWCFEIEKYFDRERFT